MPIEMVNAAAKAEAAYSAAAATTVDQPKQAMNSEVFMSLLVAQLRNQDPSSPMDTNQMIAQTTQLAMMEKLTDMSATSNESFSLQMRMAAAGLVGKEVSYKDEKGDVVTGIASGVSFAGPVPTVRVGDKDIPLDVISGVTSVATKPAAA
ncbi:MAG TPA: flagellar hook capping FlgD N-terminal domain-containing protein [Glaciibacter sp.]|nr:flagellar hook capping FlgD N-terminal domain-containing protein [Glaciibacter sp.]